MSGHCALVVCGAPLAARAPEIADVIATSGWTVSALTTPTATGWISDDALSAATGQLSRSPGDLRVPRRQFDVVVVAPLTFNSVAKMVLGIADSPAHGVLCEALGDRVPILAVLMVNDRLWGHPAWKGNVARLSQSGVQWLSIHDGSLGEPQRVASGTGGEVVTRFQPAWISDHLPG